MLQQRDCIFCHLHSFPDTSIATDDQQLLSFNSQLKHNQMDEKTILPSHSQ